MVGSEGLIPKKAPGTLSPATSPLPVLVQAVDDGVALLDEGHELLHQHLLSAPVLLRPVLFCSRRNVRDMRPRKRGTNA